ncbi:MAG: Radical domain protein [Ilumatobacteraceae bacterium]|nr:Radical domain protein [Ilumatobacteraceae bacterium]
MGEDVESTAGSDVLTEPSVDTRVAVRLSPAPSSGPVGGAKVALVRPPMLVPRLAITAPTCPPVGLAYLAGALVAHGHDVTAIDAVGEAPDQFLDCGDDRFWSHGLSAAEVVERLPADVEVIGVSCMFSHEWPLCRDLLEHLRARFPEALLVVGGEHATALPEVVLAEGSVVDVVVAGEGERAVCSVVANRYDRDALAQLPGVLVAPRSGATSPSTASVAPPVRELAVDDFARPAWDRFPIATYLDRGMGFGVHRGRSMPIVATRGCPYQCTFCSSPRMWTTRWVARSPAEVLDEIETYLRVYRATNIDFYDLTAIVHRSWIVAFCELILERGLDFTWQLPSGTRSEAIDGEVADLLGRAGCRNMSYAPESGSPAVLKRIKKKVDLDRMKQSMRASVRAKINCKANIIVGLPGETHREVLETMRFCASVAVLGLHDLSITPFSPYPGTELFDQLRAEGRIPELDDDYFLSLAAYSDLTTTVSFSEHISDRALGRYRLAGIGLFYAVSYLCRPWRVVAVVRHVFWSDTQESRLEMSLRDHLHRRHGSHKLPV